MGDPATESYRFAVWSCRDGSYRAGHCHDVGRDAAKCPPSSVGAAAYRGASSYRTRWECVAAGLSARWDRLVAWLNRWRCGIDRLPTTRRWLRRCERHGAERINRIGAARVRERAVLVAIASGLRSGDVELGGDEVARTILRRQQSAADVDLARNDRCRSRPVWWNWLATIDLGHESSPRWRSEHTTLGVVLDLLRTIEAIPDAGDEVRSIADEPDVGTIVGRPGFSARWIMEPGCPYSSR